MAITAGCGVLGLSLASVGPAKSADTEPFANGTANATAIVSRIAPGTGNLQLAMTAGIGVSEIRNDLAQSKAQSADFGLIGSSVTAPGCRGGDATIKPEDLPQPVIADNRKGDAAASHDELPVGPIGGGRAAVTATKVPSSSAELTGVGTAVPGLLDFRGGKAIANTTVVPGKAREAKATVDGSLDLGGVVQLNGLHWEAIHRTGDKPQVTGEFLLGSATAGSVPFPTDDLATLETTLNTALAPAGVTLTFPRVVHVTTPADFVQVTPLRIEVKDTPIGKTVLGPGLNLSRTQREQLFDQTAAAVCELAAALFVGDVGVGIAAGTGFLTVDLGGVSATSAATAAGNPFGADDPPPSGDTGLPASLGGGIVPVGSDGTPGTPSTPDSFVPGADAGTGSTTPDTINGESALPAAATRLESSCESKHPFRWPHCSVGAPIPLGILGFTAALGVAALDWRQQRKASRLDNGRGVPA